MSATHPQTDAEMRYMRQGSLKLDADPAYGQLLRNKRVAIVGPATTTLGTQQGSSIDAYDLVVRFNDTIDHLPFSGHLANDIGTRTDILYCNHAILQENILDQQGLSHQKFVELCDQVGIQYVVCTNNNLDFNRMGEPSTHCDVHDQNIISDFKRLLRRHGVQTKFHIVYRASELLIKWMQGYVGRTGLVAILDLLSYHLDHLYIAGMTFYHGGGHLFPQSADDLHPLKSRDGTWASNASTLGHNSYVELDLMRRLAQCFSSILELDDPLQALLEGGDSRPS